MDAVLALGGAFNPTHTQHLALMNFVKRAVEDKYPYTIVGGCLAVAPDGYVRAKLKDRAMKAKHRLAMCNLAVQDHSWLRPCDRTYGSALDCGRSQRPSDEVLVMVVVGADRALNRPERAKWRRPRPEGLVTVCVGRGGDTERVRACFSADLAANQVVDPASFILIDGEVSPVSSSQVRSELQLLHQAHGPEDKRRIARLLVENGFLHDRVAAYVLANEQDLYLT
jgi:nicotinic acid mononucleotide adenylyltransferase